MPIRNCLSKLEKAIFLSKDILLAGTIPVTLQNFRLEFSYRLNLWHFSKATEINTLLKDHKVM